MDEIRIVLIQIQKAKQCTHNVKHIKINKKELNVKKKTEKKIKDTKRTTTAIAAAPAAAT